MESKEESVLNMLLFDTCMCCLLSPSQSYCHRKSAVRELFADRPSVYLIVQYHCRNSTGLNREFHRYHSGT